MPQEFVILVDENGQATGACEKTEAHQKGLLHRAFSVFIFNADNKLILQKRSDGKYHSAGLWTNTCCGHPRPGEELKEAAKRRLKEEMGIECELEFRYSFNYRVEFGNGLTENEIDHVFTGVYSGVPQPNADEVSDWKVVSREEIRSNVQLHPEMYTHWFRLCIDQIDKICLA